MRLENLVVRITILGLVLVAGSACAGPVVSERIKPTQMAQPNENMVNDSITTRETPTAAATDIPETVPAVDSAAPSLTPAATPTATKTPASRRADSGNRFAKAPALSSATWINSSPLSSNDLADRVVLIEFWTFACYNCKNTLPFMKAWDEKYRAQGLVTIGVHTPELSFERDVNNVRQAVKDYGIKYAVAVDPDFGNWNRYHVQAWPTWFIVDKHGYIRYSHVGEGDYDQSEAVIQQLLAE